MSCLKQKIDKSVEPGNENGVQDEVKLTRFKLSQPEEIEIETPLNEQHEPLTKPVDVNEPQGENETEDPSPSN